MKTVLPAAITTVSEAEKFLRELHSNEEIFHPEDDAHQINWNRTDNLPTEAECDQLNELMGQCYELGEFDPCEFILTNLNIL